MPTLVSLGLWLAAALPLQAGADAAATNSGCGAQDQPLSFWTGHWQVFADGKLDGRDFVESTLGGCAVIEHWDDVSGMRGMSLFYFEPHAHQWKQVWVTDHATQPGGLKEKTLVHAAAGTVRFQGTVWAAPDRPIIDRTTLRRQRNGDVRQLIEYSKDGGSTWTTSYDALYRRESD